MRIYFSSSRNDVSQRAPLHGAHLTSLRFVTPTPNSSTPPSQFKDNPAPPSTQLNSPNRIQLPLQTKAFSSPLLSSPPATPYKPRTPIRKRFNP